MLNVNAGTRVTVTNHVIAHNTVLTATRRRALRVRLVRADHNTIVDNMRGAAPGEGVRIGAGGGTNVLRNNIIVGHGTGLVVAGGASVSADYDDYYDNIVRTSAFPWGRTTAPIIRSLTSDDGRLSPGAEFSGD